jgi:hypothetical protein
VRGEIEKMCSHFVASAAERRTSASSDERSTRSTTVRSGTASEVTNKGIA